MSKNEKKKKKKKEEKEKAWQVKNKLYKSDSFEEYRQIKVKHKTK